MSEYQYYEFQAVDRPLTKAELAELRAVSSRATITPTRFVNVYNFGDFGGDPSRLMDRYFDAHLYLANWGTRTLMLRLPRTLLAAETLASYCPGETAAARTTAAHAVVEFRSEDEAGDPGEDEYGDGDGRLADLLPLRVDLAGGDLRALYLGWLLCAQGDEVLDDHAVEPPVPPGLVQLSEALRGFVDFLRVDPDWLAVAAERSAPLVEHGPTSAQVEAWVRALPEGEKDALIPRVLAGDGAYLQAGLVQRLRRDHAPPPVALAGGAQEGRTVAALREAAEAYAAVRERREAATAAKERTRIEAEAATARGRVPGRDCGPGRAALGAGRDAGWVQARQGI